MTDMHFLSVVFISLTGSGARCSLATTWISSGGYTVDIWRISTGGIYDYPAQGFLVVVWAFHSDDKSQKGTKNILTQTWLWGTETMIYII